MKNYGRGIMQKYQKLYWLAFLTYIATYLGRFSFGSALAVIAASEGFTTTQLGLVTTAIFGTYGACQLFSGIIGDKFNPRTLVSIGFFGCTFANILMIFARTIPFMCAAWVINGAVCSLIFAPITRLITAEMPDEQTAGKYMLKFQYNQAIGMVLTFLMVALVTAIAPWRVVFVCTTVCVGSCAVLWTVLSPKYMEKNCTPARKEKKEKSEKPKGNIKLMFTSGLIFLLFICLYLGIVKEGISTWVPKAITDIYGTSPAFSIFMSAILPALGALGTFLTSFIQKHTGDDALLQTGIFFCAAGVILGVVALTLNLSALLTVILFSLSCLCLTGAAGILVYQLPVKFAPYGLTATVSGLTNAFCYLGSALSGVGIGMLVEHLSWVWVCLILGGLCLLGVAIALAVRPVWRKFK